MCELSFQVSRNTNTSPRRTSRTAKPSQIYKEYLKNSGDAKRPFLDSKPQTSFETKKRKAPVVCASPDKEHKTDDIPRKDASGMTLADSGSVSEGEDFDINRANSDKCTSSKGIECSEKGQETTTAYLENKV